MWFLPFERNLIFGVWTALVTHDYVSEELRGIFLQSVYPELKASLNTLGWHRKCLIHLFLIFIWVWGMFYGGFFWYAKSPEVVQTVSHRLFTSRAFVIRGPFFLLRLTLVQITFGQQEPIYI